MIVIVAQEVKAEFYGISISHRGPPLAPACCPLVMVIPSFFFTAFLFTAMVALGWHYRASNQHAHTRG
ncbi:MAG: hypothetical protein H7330_05850 [Hymenobacteraceae bacterium]|nr:hypothetical protein [Hymenobacteraceae bacterium]